MGQRADGKYGGPDGVNEVNFGEKTSEYGHYALSDFGHAGMNEDGTKWKSQNMEWIEDNRSFQAPSSESKPKKTNKNQSTQQDRNAWEIDYRDLRNGNFEGLPEQVKEPPTGSQVQQAQDLVDAYTADITAGKSTHNTSIQSPTPNLNTQTPTADAAVESNTYIDPEYSVNNPEKKAAEAFLDAKKIQFGSGLKL